MEKDVKHVVMYSGGAGSALVGKMVADKYGAENTVFLHTDTKWEDEDCYRFMKDVSEYVKVPITFKNDGRSPEDVFNQLLYFGNFGTAPCSKELKMKMTFEYIQELFLEGIQPILYFGIDYKEVRRAPRIAYNYKHNIDVFEDGLEVRFPLIGTVDGEFVNGEQLLYETNYLQSEKMPPIKNDLVYSCLAKQNFIQFEGDVKDIIANEMKVELPRMYELGFKHANCGGRCIKAGKKHFKTLYEVWKDRYIELETIEKNINIKQVEKGNKPYTILSEKINDKKSPYSLERYRLEVLEKNLKVTVDEEDTPCECVF
jgi:hypothetical protein